MVLSMEKWSGKVAIVTGASYGIGKTIVEHLVAHGLTVIGIARSSELVEENARELENEPGTLHALKADVSQPDQIIAAFEKIGQVYGPVHILINNAAVVHQTSLVDGDIELWKENLYTNLYGVSVATKEALANMNKNGVVGHIININSLVGHKIPFPQMNMYAVAKHGLTALTESVRMELAQKGSKIKITSLSPGLTKTSNFESANFDFLKLGTMPYVLPEDVADAAIYALSTPAHVEIKELTIIPVGVKH